MTIRFINVSFMRALIGMMIFIMVAVAGQSSQGAELLTLQLNNVNLVTAINLLAKAAHMNVVVSPTVEGILSLNFHNARPEDALNSLLIAQGLAKYQIETVWYIAAPKELQLRAEEEKNIQELLPLVTKVWQMHYAKAQEVAHLLQDSHYSLLSKRGSVHADARTNTVFVQEMQSKQGEIAAIIKKLDVPVRQIMLEARLVSIDHQYEKALGLAVNQHTLPSAVEALPAHQLNVALVKLTDVSLLDVQLAALERAGHAELISSPSLFTLNQQTATIESGEEIPYQETLENGGTSVSFKKAVLRLRVTPQLMPGDKMLLQLQINQDKPSSRIILGMPAIATRQIATNILIGNGQTLVLGGIYEMTSERGELGVPYLDKIPLFGWLFRQHTSIASKRELLIFVTPKIITQYP